MHDVSVMSIDTNNRMLYWIDEYNFQLYRAHLTPSSLSLTTPQVLLSEDNEHEIQPSSVAIDWIGQNLYITDSTHGCIWVMKSDGRYATKIITGIEAPWVVAVNPILGILYFINYEPEGVTHTDERIVAIESAYMNGENWTILVDTDIVFPTDLVIDFYQNHRVYWTDEKKQSIESMNYDGTDRVTLAHVGIHAPHSLDIFANNLYWINRDNRSLNSIDKFGRGLSSMLLDGLQSPLFVRVYHPLKQIQSGFKTERRSS